MAHKIDFPPPPKIKQPINTTKTINNIIVIDSSKIGGSTPINQPNILSPIPTIQNLQPIITSPKIQTPPSPPITIYPIINNIIVIDSSKIGGSTPINQPNILSPIPTIQNLQPIIDKTVDPIVNNLPTTINPSDVVKSGITISNQIISSITPTIKPKIDNTTLYLIIFGVVIGVYVFVPNKKKINNNV